MDKDIKALLELNRDAALVIEGGKIVLANSAAERLFGAELSGKFAGLYLPDHIYLDDSRDYTASLAVGELSCSASCLRRGNSLFVCIHPDMPAARSEFVNAYLMGNMLSALCNAGIAIERLQQSANCSDARRDEYMSILSHNFYRLRHSITNLHTAVQLRDSELHLQLERRDLCSLCSRLVSSVSILLSALELNMSFSSSLSELYAPVDAEKTERMLLNLISNSCRHCSPGGRVAVTLEKQGSRAVICVSDNGSGISPQHMSRIFTRYRDTPDPDSLREATEGGLGLGVARGLAEAHGGALIVESRKDCGTSVRIMLPLNDGCTSVLASPPPERETGSMDILLTELAPLLDTALFTPSISDR